MLHVYGLSLQVAKDVSVVAREIARVDPDLARQLVRAVQSVVLNIAEGDGSRGRNRGLRFHSALGSAKEVMACVDVARAMSLVGDVEEGVVDRMDHLVGALTRLVVGR